jgi:flagellar biosynthesis protein FlhG
VRRPEPDDQAAGLRRLLGEQNAFRAVGLIGPDAELNACAAAGLAFALAHQGGRVCILDEAPGPRNVAGQLGLTPRHGLADAARGEIHLEDALVGLDDGLSLLRAERGLSDAAESDDRLWSRLSDDFAAGAWEWLVLNTPEDERPSLALAAPLRLLVLPAVKARLTEAYAVLKAAHRRQPDVRWLALFMHADDDQRTGQLMTTLNETTRRFLGLEIALLGAVPRDAKLDIALRSMRPVHEVSPAAPAATAFRHLAGVLRGTPADFTTGMDAKVFWQRLGLFGRLNRQPRQPSTRHVQHGRAYG